MKHNHSRKNSELTSKRAKSRGPVQRDTKEVLAELVGKLQLMAYLSTSNWRTNQAITRIDPVLRRDFFDRQSGLWPPPAASNILSKLRAVLRPTLDDLDAVEVTAFCRCKHLRLI